MRCETDIFLNINLRTQNGLPGSKELAKSTAKKVAFK